MKTEEINNLLGRFESIACEQAGLSSADHFPGIGKMVGLGSRSERNIDDIMLIRYAYYL